MDGVRTAFYERDERTAAGLTARWATVTTAGGGSHLEMTWVSPTERATDASTTVTAADELPSQRGRVTA
jgi:hypothetical protein